jgi:MFS family permease
MNEIKERKSTKIPFSPAKIPFFYGWIILAMGIFGVIMSIPGQTMGVSVFTDDLIRVLKMSRVNLSLSYLIGTIMSALILTPAGKKLDKLGIRPIGTAVVFLLGAVLFGLSFLDRIIGGVVSVTGAGQKAVAFIIITISFFLLRFLGQGMLTMMSRNMVMKWFDKQRGMANAILGVFTSFGFSLAPKFLNGMIETGGWNGAWRNLGLGMLTAGAVVFLIISRDNPFECGMKPDSRWKGLTKRTRPAGHPERDFTLAEARKTLPFWIFGLTLAMQSLFVTSLTFHIISIFDSAGIGKVNAIGIFLPASFIAVTVNFIVSLLSDYIKLRYILLTHQIGLIICMFFVSRLGSGLAYVMVIISYGFISGFFSVCTTIVWPRYYGITHLGAITGMVMGFMVAGSAIGPYFFSLVEKYTGSYNGASMICLGIVLVLFIFSFKVKRPVHPAAAARD